VDDAHLLRQLCLWYERSEYIFLWQECQHVFETDKVCFANASTSGQMQGAAKQSLERGGRPVLFPANEHDPVVDFYRLLPVILDRCFPSQQAIHRQLIEPWKSHAFLRVRPPRAGTIAPSLVPNGPLQPTISRYEPPVTSSR